LPSSRPSCSCGRRDERRYAETKPTIIDATMTAFLRTLSDANKSASTITAYRTRTDAMLWVVTEWDPSA